MDVKNFFKYLYERRKSIKYSVLNVVKLICSVIFVYQIILLTIDYLSFPYRVKLDIIDDKQTLPAITICSHYYFSKEKIKSYFNITYEFYKVSKENSNISSKNFESIFYEKYLKIILNDFSVNKLELTISAKDLFNCSANLHELKNLEHKLIFDCEEKTRVIESFYDKYLGKCFTYFEDISFDRESFIFLNNDFIQFETKDKKLFDLEFGIKNSWTSLYSIFIRSPRMSYLQPDDASGSFIGGSISEFRFRMTRISFLSWPYEHDCYEYTGIFLA